MLELLVTVHPTVMVIQKLGKKSIQTHRGSSDVQRHIIKNVSRKKNFESSLKQRRWKKVMESRVEGYVLP